MKLALHTFLTLDGVLQAPGGPDEDPESGFPYGGWSFPFNDDDFGVTMTNWFGNVDAFLLGRKTYVEHAEAFEPMPAGDPFGDMMNSPKKYVVSRTLEKPVWRDTTIIRDNIVDEVRALKAQPGKNILLDGSSQLVHTLLEHDLVDELHLLVYPLMLGSGKRVFPNGVRQEFKLTATTPYPSGVVGLHYVRPR